MKAYDFLLIILFLGLGVFWVFNQEKKEENKDNYPFKKLPWESAKKISVKMFTRPDGALEYDLHGAIFFASTTKFKSLFDFSTDTSEIYIDFADARVHDHSGIEAINWITEQYSNAGKKLHLLHLSEDCRELLETAGDMIEVNMIEDPHYWVADDKLA